MLFAGLGFAIMGACVKAAAQRYHPAELVFYRSLFGLLSIGLIVLWQGQSIKSPMLGLHLRRASLGGLALLCFFYAIAHLPLATAITLNYTSPLFLALLSPWLLKQERHLSPMLKRLLALGIVVGFVGVCLSLQPVFSAQRWLPAAVGLLSGLGAALAYVHVKQLAMQGEPDWRTVFYFTAVTSLGSALVMLCDRFTRPTWHDAPVLLSLGLSATLSQLAMTRAYRTGHTLSVASLAYSTVVFATLIGGWVFGESLQLHEIIGMLLIIVVGILSSQFR